MYTVTIDTYSEFDILSPHLEQLAMVGFLVTLDHIGIDSELKHEILVTMTTRTKFNDPFGGKLLLDGLDVFLAVAVSAGGCFRDAHSPGAAMN